MRTTKVLCNTITINIGYINMISILVLHGPNLNLLGTREPAIYGSETLEMIDNRLKNTAKDHGYQLETLQSNAEYVLIDRIHQARQAQTEFIIINPAAFTHTSVALRDALLAVDIPFIEVHLSNIHTREPFRQKSFFSDVATGVICGLGSKGYDAALNIALERLQSVQKS